MDYRLFGSPKQLIAHLQWLLSQPLDSTNTGYLYALIEQVLAADSLLDDCILVCGLLAHKYSLSSAVLFCSTSRTEDNKLRSLWMQVAITRARIQANEAVDASVLFSLLREAAMSNDNILVARGLECLQLLLTSSHFLGEFLPSKQERLSFLEHLGMRVLVEASPVPSDLVHYRIREIVKLLCTKMAGYASRLVEIIRDRVREGCKLRYQLLAICQYCPPLTECSWAFADRALVHSVSECMQYADEAELVEWIARLKDGQTASMVVQLISAQDKQKRPRSPTAPSTHPSGHSSVPYEGQRGENGVHILGSFPRSRRRCNKAWIACRPTDLASS